MEGTGKDQGAMKIWGEYEDALGFQRAMGFASKFPEYERFKTGDQWPPATDRTKALPRPVFNIIDLFVSNKKSNVLNQNIKMVFSSAEAGTVANSMAAQHAIEGAESYTKYAESLWYELDQDGLNDRFVEDAATTGTGILHYYWDQSVSGGQMMPYLGALRGENIDPLNLFVSNPQEEDIQKQDYVIISSRLDLERVRKMAKEEGVSEKKIQMIHGDQENAAEGYDAARTEQQGTDKVTILTKYFRKNGAVYFSRCTNGVMLVDAKPLSPMVLPEKEEDALEEVGMMQPAKITLYPIAIFRWKTRKKCLWGYGEVEGIIPNQKAINFNIAMMLLSVQDNGWPKIVAKPGALRQTITNLPGEILTDYYSVGDGVKYMQPPNFNYMAVNLVDKVMELSRTTSGVTEISTGEQIGTNMAASAIIALQNQAKVPIDNIQKRYYRSIRDVGRIWEQFFKTYYNMPKTMLVDQVDGGQTAEIFLGQMYQDVDFKLKIDVGPTSMYSESLSVATLEKLFDTGNISLEEYIDLAPHNVMPFKDKLKQMMANRMMQQAQMGMPMQTSQPMMQGQPMQAEGAVMEMANEMGVYPEQQEALSPQVAGMMRQMGAQI